MVDMNANILVVDDERDLLELLSLNLSAEGYTITTVETGKEAISAIETERPDLILLDIMLEDISGIQLTGKLKNSPETASIPIILLTAKDTEMDMVVGLSVGADDYVTKPFSTKILVARIEAVLRRAYPDPTAGHQILTAGDVRVMVDSRRVTASGEAIELTIVEYEILVALIQAGGKVLSRNDLKTHLGAVAQSESTRIIDVHVATLRKKLGPARKIIKTVHRIGYRIATERPKITVQDDPSNP